MDVLDLKLDFSRQNNYVWNYIRDTFQQSNPDFNEIHLVFQGLGNSAQQYFLTYNLVNQYIAAEESFKEKAIQDKITTNERHIAAAGKPENLEVEKQIS